ncbi:TolC family protein [Roseiconus nitratireducens]|uniref:TolC family protein n=1 Tax=Roseiconus nitratireducens TaxID=2605748 RepID=UPI0036F1DDDD
MPRFRARPLGWLTATLLLAAVGCAGGDVAGTFRTTTPPPFSASGEAWVPDRWWMTFEDPRLDGHINRALDDSFTLAAALQRVVAARALARREASDLFPDVNGVADIAGDYGPGPDLTRYTLGLDASYQVDLWGQIESRVDAERLRASATDADYHVVALTLAAEITRTYFSMIEANAQLALLSEQIETNRTGLAAQDARFRVGLIRYADVLRQQQLVESTLEQAAVVGSRIDVLEHQMAVLLGQLPQDAEYDPGDQLPALPPLPDTGVPSELLRRRPDVRRDYLAFMAADRDLASAITAQYPRISLTGSVLNVADRPENLFRDWFVGIGGQLIAPLIDGGQRRAQVDLTAALVRQRFNEYGQTMLNAFREVEDALARERYQLERLEHLEAQSELARQASEQLREQYLIGDADYLDVLSTITAEQRLQRETLAARLELLLIRVSLYLALAGDFDPRPQELLEISGISVPEPLPAEAESGLLEIEELPAPEAIPEAESDELPVPDDAATELEQLLKSVERLPTTDIDD